MPPHLPFTPNSDCITWHTLQNLLYISQCLTPHIYKFNVVMFIVFYAAVIEIAFGVLERGMTQSEPSVCDVCYDM
jgi:hypothetical protein